MSWKPNIILASAVILAAASMAGSALAADIDQNLAAGEEQAKQLLLLMDKDQNGMVSKAEFMAFMDAEFDRLDKDHNGELNVQELTQVPIHSSGAVHR